MPERKSSDEKEAERAFQRHKRRLIRVLGRQALFSDQIDGVGRALFGQHWGGVHHQNSFKAVKRPGGTYAVLNTAMTDTSPGVHWIGVYVSPVGVVHVWDSFGRDTKHLAWPMRRNATQRGFGFEGSDRDAQQRGASQTCGPQSLAWLATVRELGIRKAMLV